MGSVRSCWSIWPRPPQERGIRASPPRCSVRTPRCSGCSSTPATPCTGSTTPVSWTCCSTSNPPRSPGRCPGTPGGGQVDRPAARAAVDRGHRRLPRSRQTRPHRAAQPAARRLGRAGVLGDPGRRVGAGSGSPTRSPPGPAESAGRPGSCTRCGRCSGNWATPRRSPTKPWNTAEVGRTAASISPAPPGCPDGRCMRRWKPWPRGTS